MVVAAGGNTEMLRWGWDAWGGCWDTFQTRASMGCVQGPGSSALLGAAAPPGDRQMDGWTDGAWREPR